MTLQGGCLAMSKVTKINPRATPAIQDKKLRVAAYCRVSTMQESQADSLEAQKSHYEKYIKSRDDWEYAGLYYDEGITGTKQLNRPGLMQLIEDCELRKIDFVVTKSISRLSRNTTDCLEIVRKLLELDIPIYFEKENIDTGSMESELFLSILSGLAADESASISSNNKWSIQKRFQNGTYKMASAPYGYDWDGEHMIINDEQAPIVKRIFEAALSGKGAGTIAKELNADGIPPKRGRAWTNGTILQMLQNEKYIGNTLFQKSYTDSQYNRHINNGQHDKYLIANTHEAIVAQADFDTAAKMIAQRSRERGVVKGTDKYLQRYPLSGKIVCGECGDTFKRRIHSQKKNKYVCWCCSTHLKDSKECSMLFIREDLIHQAFITMMNKLIYSGQVIIKPLIDALNLNTNDANFQQVQELRRLIAQNNDERDTLTRLMTTGLIDHIVFNQENNRILAEADSYKQQIEALSTNQDGDNAKVTQLKELLKFAKTAEMLSEFDEELFGQFVESVHVATRTELYFELKCGLKLKERLG